MERLALVSSPKMLLGCSPSPRTGLIDRPFLGLPVLTRRVRQYGGSIRPMTCLSSLSPSQSTSITKRIVLEKVGSECFASINSSSTQETSSVGVSQQLPVPSSPSHVGSPLFWIGVGVGLSALFSWVAAALKRHAMKQAFNAFMGQMNTQNNQFSNAGFPSGSPFPFPLQAASGPTPSPNSVAIPTATVDVAATKVETSPAAEVIEEAKSEKGPKKYAFVDVSPEETFQKSPFEKFKESTESGGDENMQSVDQVSQNGAASKPEMDASTTISAKSNAGSQLSVEALEKMMEDPTVQKMVYPYLPEEMRNPTTFKWMLQNPQYRQQLQDMLNKMGGNAEWDNRIMDSLKNFDLSSPDVRQQFDQIGLTPEEVISKIMANPDVAMAFQNPRVQAAIMDCSQNPLSIAKYQNDKEVMDVFNKISELFPGVTGS